MMIIWGYKAQSWFSLPIQCCLDKTCPTLDPRLCVSLSHPCPEFWTSFLLFFSFLIFLSLDLPSRHHVKVGSCLPTSGSPIDSWPSLKSVLSEWKQNIASAVLSAKGMLLVLKNCVPSWKNTAKKKANLTSNEDTCEPPSSLPKWQRPQSWIVISAIEGTTKHLALQLPGALRLTLLYPGRGELFIIAHHS